MPSATSLLISKLNTSSDKAAEAVILNLSKIGRRAVPELMKAARDKSQPRIRKWSLQALGAIGDRRAGPLLKSALSDERMTVKLHAIRGLARMNYKPAAVKLRALLSDSSGGIRVNSLDALIKLESRSSAKAIIASLFDPQWYVRQHASRACRELGLKTAITHLEKLTKTEKRAAVLKEAKSAIAALTT